MAGGAIIYGVAFLQREEAVVHGVGGPTGCFGIVALEAICRKAGIAMVGVGGIVEIIEVAGSTVVADAVETQARLGGVALGTTHGCMHADEGKTLLLVQPGDVVHEPIVGGVATGAITADGVLVDVSMATDARALSLRKYQAFMAIATVHECVLARERKSSLAVVEKACVHVGLRQPALLEQAEELRRFSPMAGWDFPTLW